MPCQSCAPSSSVSEAYAREDFRHNSDVAELLCELCQHVEYEYHNEGGSPPSSIMSTKLQKWWAEHQERDRKKLRAEHERRKTEKAKKAALSKLSEYERRLLNLE